jgi:hypothetical protein
VIDHFDQMSLLMVVLALVCLATSFFTVSPEHKQPLILPARALPRDLFILPLSKGQVSVQERLFLISAVRSMYYIWHFSSLSPWLDTLSPKCSTVMKVSHVFLW